MTVESTRSTTTALSTGALTTNQSSLITHSSSQGSTIPADRITTTYFIAPNCHDSTLIGSECNISNTPCDILEPCQNNGLCNNTDQSYICICSDGFNGTRCQFDHRPCKLYTCWNNGTCKNMTNTTFNCTCAFGWTGIHCETKINYCQNVTCSNNGVCRILICDYKCECLGDSFSGRHCEITANYILIRQIVSKSFAFIAILAGLSVITFVVIMDILKYCFGIDLTHDELERIRQKKRAKKVKRPVIVRYIYFNAPLPSTQPKCEPRFSTIHTTTI